jgi:Fe-Mn family superoxide dismutase
VVIGRRRSTMRSVSRRGFIGGLGMVAGGLFVSDLRAAVPPKETGLSSEGLLVGRPGFQPRTVMPLPHPELPGFLSRAQLEAHHAQYAGDVERLEQCERQLREATLDADRYGELRRAQVAAANSVLLHEFYFGGLAPAKVDVPPALAPHMREHMGLMEDWSADFTRCAMTAKRWAALVYDPYDDRWHNTVMDGDDAGIWVGVNPLLVCDVADHAFVDYGSRDQYVARFMERIDWNEVARRYKAVDRM